MKRLVFDCEANNLLPLVTKAHCIAAEDPDTGEKMDWKPDELPNALEVLDQADELWGHNSIGYDFQLLEKLYGFRVPIKKQKDTLVCSRLIYPNLGDTDGDLVSRGVLPGKLHGRHSVEAWGYRLGHPKLHADIEDWSEWTPEMHERCVGDVSSQAALLRHLNPAAYSQQAIDLEHRVARVCQHMTTEGWPFDEQKAGELHAHLLGEQDRLRKELVADFGSWKELQKEFIAKVSNAKLGRKKGDLVQVYKEIEFNPASRHHIIKQLKLLGWEPTAFTDAGQPKVDDEILASIATQYPQAAKLARFLMLDKRLGQLADGSNAWLKLVTKGKIHASYNPNGAVTGRAAHFGPNIAQVPAIKDRKGNVQPYGKECRELFRVPEGWKLVGADMSGLELRCLSHYLHPIDGGAYAQVLLDGDVHTFNQNAAGLPERNMAKTFIYAWLYGAGAEKIGKIVGGSKVTGRKLIDQFLEAVPAVAELKEKVVYNVRVTRGYLKGLDGRLLPIRSEHAALNTLLQSAGAILCKEWLADSYAALQTAGLKPGWNGDFSLCAWVHDEVQIACKEGLEEQIGAVVTQCAKRAGEPYGFRVRLDSEYKAGSTWASTH